MTNDSGATPPDAEIWMVRAGRGGAYADYFLNGSVVALGWGDIGEITAQTPNAEIRGMIDKAYPDAKNGTRSVWSGQIARFFKGVKVGDPVVTYDNESRTYHLGKILSDAERNSDGGMFFRKVEWTDEAPRNSLSVAARNALGSQLTFFRLSSEVSEELRRRAAGEPSGGAAQDRETPARETESGSIDAGDEVLDEDTLIKEYIDKSEQFVEDAIMSLQWDEIQELVAGILRAEGYKTRISSRGPDQGVDIFASPDGLGFVEPRIFVEVKHHAGSIGAPAIRSFIGGRQDGDICLYVSTGGFSREARYEAARARVRLTLMNVSDLRNLLVDRYEALDPETRALVPLKKVYWPVRLNDL